VQHAAVLDRAPPESSSPSVLSHHSPNFLHSHRLSEKVSTSQTSTSSPKTVDKLLNDHHSHPNPTTTMRSGRLPSGSSINNEISRDKMSRGMPSSEVGDSGGNASSGGSSIGKYASQHPPWWRRLASWVVANRPFWGRTKPCALMSSMEESPEQAHQSLCFTQRYFGADGKVRHYPHCCSASISVSFGLLVSHLDRCTSAIRMPNHLKQGYNRDVIEILLRRDIRARCLTRILWRW
jgi:hypothetical protein